MQKQENFFSEEAGFWNFFEDHIISCSPNAPADKHNSCHEEL
jgi:hypothetical protein